MNREEFGELIGYLERNPGGGGLHLVVDDENFADKHVRWCTEWLIGEIWLAAAEICDRLDHAEVVRLRRVREETGT